MTPNDELSGEEITAEIKELSRYEMCRLWRFAPSGHRYFDNTRPYYVIFKKRFDELGGFSPEISKQLG